MIYKARVVNSVRSVREKTIFVAFSHQFPSCPHTNNMLSTKILQ